MSLALAGRFFTTSATWEALKKKKSVCVCVYNWMIFYVLGILKYKQRIPSTVMVNYMFYLKLLSKDN